MDCETGIGVGGPPVADCHGIAAGLLGPAVTDNGTGVLAIATGSTNKPASMRRHAAMAVSPGEIKDRSDTNGISIPVWRSLFGIAVIRSS